MRRTSGPRQIEDPNAARSQTDRRPIAGVMPAQLWGSVRRCDARADESKPADPNCRVPEPRSPGDHKRART
eukprot:5569908-Alexandrium_andersonii.AAC.1